MRCAANAFRPRSPALTLNSISIPRCELVRGAGYSGSAFPPTLRLWSTETRSIDTGNLLLPLFFVVTGLSLNLGALPGDAFVLLAVIVAVAAVGKLGPGTRFRARAACARGTARPSPRWRIRGG